MSRASARVLAVGVTIAVGVASGAPSAARDPSPASSLNWVFDGAVQTAARLGDTLYVGGTFTAVAPPENALPPVYALSQVTGAVLPPALPSFAGEVYAIEPDGSGGYFLGGNFTSVGTVAQRYLAHVLSDGSFDPAFSPVLFNSVSSLARIGTTLYVLGAFSGVAADQIGAVSTTTGARVAWAPSLPSIGGITTLSRLIAGDDRIVVLGSVDFNALEYTFANAYDAVTGALLWEGGAGGQVGVRAGTRVIVAQRPLTPHTRPLLPYRVVSLSLATGAVDPAWTRGDAVFAMAVSGSTLYLAGSIATVAGEQPRALAAIDVATGVLLPWSPGPSGPVTTMVVSGSGSVYVGGSFEYIGGAPRQGLAEIDAAGAVTPWVADARPRAVHALREGAPGTLVVSSALTAHGNIPRRSAAAFDLVSGTLLPWAPTLAADTDVEFVAAGSGRVYLGQFDEIARPYVINAVDAATGAGVAVTAGEAFHADGTWLYWTTRSPWEVRRLALATGAVDPSFRVSLRSPPPARAVSDATTLYLASGGLTAVDILTGRVRWHVAEIVSHLALSGDTLFAVVGFAGLGTFDARTGVAIMRFPGSGYANLTVADARVIVSGGTPSPMSALTFAGQATAWNPGLANTPLPPGGGTFELVGDRLVAGGNFGRRAAPALQGLAVFPLEGAVAPSDLRARPKGPATEFTWQPPASAPAGGYVLEASVTPGQPTFTLPLGNVTSFTTVVPPGTFFVRVRAVGAANGQDELSNEIAVRGGCAAVPAPPTGLVAELTGSLVTLSWTAPDALVNRYLLEVGTTSGLTNLLTATVAGSQTSFAAAAPPATYFVRARAVNACGTSAASGEVALTVGASDPLPTAPTGLGVVVTGSTVQFAWTAPAGPITGYVLEAGLEIGLATLGSFPVGATPGLSVTGVPPGVYVARVRAITAAGSGPPSGDVVIRVP